MKILKLKVGEMRPLNFTGMVEHFNGSQEYYVDGELHRDDGPAAIMFYGVEFWCQNGRVHREDGPAIIRQDGKIKEWWLKGYIYSSQADWFEALTPEQKEKALWSEDFWTAKSLL